MHADAKLLTWGAAFRENQPDCSFQWAREGVGEGGGVVSWTVCKQRHYSALWLFAIFIGFITIQRKKKRGII